MVNPLLCYKKKRNIPALIPLWLQRATQGTSTYTGPSLPFTLRTKMLFDTLIGNFNTHKILLYDLPTSNWEIGLHVIVSLTDTDPGLSIPRNPM
jgi:hypothetical protein